MRPLQERRQPLRIQIRAVVRDGGQLDLETVKRMSVRKRYRSPVFFCRRRLVPDWLGCVRVWPSPHSEGGNLSRHLGVDANIFSMLPGSERFPLK